MRWCFATSHMKGQIKNEQCKYTQRTNNNHDNKEDNKYVEEKIVMLTIKKAAELVDGLTEYRVRELCRSGKLPCFKAGKKYLINKDILHKFLCGDIVGK